MISPPRLAAFAAFVLLAGFTSTRAESLILVAGTGHSPDGSAAVLGSLDAPFGVDFDHEGSMYIVEMVGHRVRKVDRKGVLTTFAGTGRKGDHGDGGPALDAEFNGMHSLVVSPGNTIYITDTWNNRVRKIDPATGRISAFAGTGEKGFDGDGGPALNAQFGGVYCIALDPLGKHMYLADLDNHRIRAVDLGTGLVETIAGNGKRGLPDDGANAKESPLVDPRAVAADGEGNVYIVERSGHAVRVVGPDGKIHTIIGTGKAGASLGDGDPLSVQLNGPKYISINQRNGDVFIADTENHRVLKYLPKDRKVVLVAGTGKKGSKGLGGPPTEAELSQPHGVHVGPDGPLYISDSSNNRVLKIVP
ncbi:MAG: hypothetical protein ABI353_15105 [Isosphaeraceae bacterium]